MERGAKSFGKKILQYLHDRVEEGGRIGGNLWRPLHHATNHVWDFGKSVCRADRCSRDWPEVFSPRFVFYFHLLPQPHPSPFLRTTPGTSVFSFSHSPCSFFLHVPPLFSSRPFWPFTDNVTITSQCSGNRGHLYPYIREKSKIVLPSCARSRLTGR